MAHIRTRLRNAARDALAGVSGAAWGAGVYTSRGHLLNEAQLPAILVETGGEAVSREADDTLLRRDIDLVVTCLVSSAGTAADDLDSMAVDVETAIIGAHNTSTGFFADVFDIYPTSLSPDYGSPSENTEAVLEIAFRATVIVDEDQPEGGEAAFAAITADTVIAATTVIAAAGVQL